MKNQEINLNQTIIAKNLITLIKPSSGGAGDSLFKRIDLLKNNPVLMWLRKKKTGGVIDYGLST